VNEIARHLLRLRAQVREEGRAQVLLDTLPVALDALRAAYPTHRAAFGVEDIRFLRRAAAMIPALEDYITLHEALDEIQTVIEAADYMEALQECFDVCMGAAVAQRIGRDMRGLRERFPGSAAAAREVARASRLRALEINAWPCRCGEWMTLRMPSSGGDPYWGCTTYPRCTYTHPLTDNQRHFLRTGQTAARP